MSCLENETMYGEAQIRYKCACLRSYSDDQESDGNDHSKSYRELLR